MSDVIKYSGLFLIIIFFLLSSCNYMENKPTPFPMETDPWKEIRKERIEKLLPAAMKEAGLESWIVICRENNNDPLAEHVGGENAGGTAAFLFFLKVENFNSIAVSPRGEATALAEMELHDTVIATERNKNIWSIVADKISEYDPSAIAINSSEYNISDGLSYTQRTALEKALGKKYAGRLVPSTDLIFEWLSVKLPQEIEIMSRAANITADLEIEAYKTIVPGKTTDADVAKYIKMRMKELEVTDAWASDQNPNVNSGKDRGHSHATDKVIQPGDVIQTDFGIKVYGRWVTDVQRFAYVLRPGETDAPDSIKYFFKSAVNGHRKILEAMKPGVSGWSIDKIQRDNMNETKSLPVMWGTGHPVGYWAHDAGPSLSGAARADAPYGNNARKLKIGQTFAYDGFYSWKLSDGSTKTISVEEMAVITEDGAVYMTKPQEELILIK